MPLIVSVFKIYNAKVLKLKSGMMKQSFLYILSKKAFFFALIFINFFQGIKAINHDYTIITEQWPPFNYLEENQLKGSVSKLVLEIMKDLKIKKTIEVLPSARVMNLLDQSQKIIFFSYILTEERRPKFNWIGPVAQQTIYFYQNKKSKHKFKSMKDAKSASSICLRDSVYVYNRLISLGFKNLDVSVSAESIYLKAILGRCELAISETTEGYRFWMKKLNKPVDSLIRTHLHLKSAPLYIIASKNIENSIITLWQKNLEKIK